MEQVGRFGRLLRAVMTDDKDPTGRGLALPPGLGVTPTPPRIPSICSAAGPSSLLYMSMKHEQCCAYISLSHPTFEKRIHRHQSSRPCRCQPHSRPHTPASAARTPARSSPTPRMATEHSGHLHSEMDRIFTAASPHRHTHHHCFFGGG